MSWGMIGAAAIGTAGSIYMSSQEKKGGGGEGPALNLPTFYEDPSFRPSQDLLLTTGKRLVTGDTPDFLKSIAETGSPEFTDVLRRTTADIERAGLESAAKTGRTGPGVSFGISKAVGETTSKLNFADMLRAIEGKKFLFGKGLETTSGVRNAGLERGRQENAFNLGRTELGIRQSEFGQTLDVNQQAREDEMFSGILSSGIGALGNIYATKQVKDTPGKTKPRGSAKPAAKRQNKKFESTKNLSAASNQFFGK